MLFQKKTEYQPNETLVYFVEEQDRIQGTLKAYSPDRDKEIREELLLYTQEFKDGEPLGEKDLTFIVTKYKK